MMKYIDEKIVTKWLFENYKKKCCFQLTGYFEYNLSGEGCDRKGLKCNVKSENSCRLALLTYN